MEGYIDAYTLFSKGELCFAQKRYNETIDLLREAYNLIGEDGLKKIGNLFKGTSEKYIKQHEFYAMMCKSYYCLEKYENALEYGNKWRNDIFNHYGHESILLVDCYKYLALIHAKLKLPEKEFAKEREGDQTWAQIFDTMRTDIRVYPLSLLNIQIPMEYYMKAYNLLKSKNGVEHEEAKNLKQEIVEYQSGCWLTMQVERTLWLAIFLIPVMGVIIPIVTGFTWKALGLFLLGISFFMVWRIINAIIIVTITYRHYQKAI